MTTSGIYQLPDEDVTQTSIILDAVELLQAAGSGEGLDAQVALTGRTTLNKMMKRWQSQGIHLWTYTEYSLFLERGKEQYDLRDSDTRIVNEFFSTELAADESAADTTIEVDSLENMLLGQAIGIIDNNNKLFWTVIERFPGGGNNVQIRDGLEVDSRANNIVRFYDTKNRGDTTLAVAAPATTNPITVATTAGMGVGYNIGIQDDTGAVQWTTINAIDADNDQVTLNDAIASASAQGNPVIFYETEQNFIPLSRVLNDMVRRHAGEKSDYEIPIVFQSRKDYFDLPNKKQIGTPIQAYYSRQEPQGIWYLWNVPSDSIEYINFTAERFIQILTADPDETLDIPQYWLDAVTYNLAKMLIPKIGCSQERRIEIRTDAREYLDEALAFDSAVYPVRLKPQRYG